MNASQKKACQGAFLCVLATGRKRLKGLHGVLSARAPPRGKKEKCRDEKCDKLSQKLIFSKTATLLK